MVSSGGLSANEKEENMASHDKSFLTSVVWKKNREEESLIMFVISDSYGLYFQPPRRLKHFLYYVSEPIVVAKSLLEDVS